MFRTFRSEWYEKKLNKLSNQEQKRVSDFEQSLKQNPLQGRPLGYDFFREKKSITQSPPRGGVCLKFC